MIYNKQYDRWVSKDGLVYRYSTRQNKLILCNQSTTNIGYNLVSVNKKSGIRQILVHRIVWETFNGSIPNGTEIDHINTNKNDNRLENLRCVSKTENMNNILTRLKRLKNDFSIKFYEHYKIFPGDNKILSEKEKYWYQRHNKKCRWE